MQRCLNVCLSSYGQQLMMEHSPLIILLREVSLWLIGVVYAATMGNQQITFFFIVSFLMPYGVKLLQCLGSSGHCRGQKTLFSLSREIGLESIFQPFGIWSHHV